MIVTFTANPSIDRTLELPGELRRGEFHRAAECRDQASGKGLNVARALSSAGHLVTSVVAFADDAYSALARSASDVDPIVAMFRPGLRVRTNITITEPDGTTTKVNEPGPVLDAEDASAITDAVAHVVRQFKARWLVLSGSLPPGTPEDWYVQIIRAVRTLELDCRMAVDTSGTALTAVCRGLAETPVDLLKPNVDELAELLECPAEQLQAAADAGDFGLIVAGARELQRAGVADVLVSLGRAGAVLVTAEGAWHAPALPTAVRSTVGAGDATVAGFLLGCAEGLDAPARLSSAVAHGSAAAGSPGSELGHPTPADVQSVVTTQLAEPVN